jgi:hypothetical protein
MLRSYFIAAGLQTTFTNLHIAVIVIVVADGRLVVRGLHAARVGLAAEDPQSLTTLLPA